VTLPLTPESRPSVDAETRLQGFVFPSVLDGRPDEEADDKSRGENYEDGDHDRCCDIHVKKMLPDRARLQSLQGETAARTSRLGCTDGSPRARIAAFKNELDRAHVPATVRLTRGRDIEAACAQLATAPKARQRAAATAR
jgi:hypothetical protein